MTQPATTAATTSSLFDRAAVERFWANVEVIDDNTSCWLWVGRLGAREPSGHVRLYYQGVKIFAHRLSYLLAGGVIADGEVVRHAVCDVSHCVRPSHLQAGTVMDNVRDREDRDRRTPNLPHGAEHWSAKLTSIDADRLREFRGQPVRPEVLAAIFGVSRSTVYDVWAGRRY